MTMQSVLKEYEPRFSTGAYVRIVAGRIGTVRKNGTITDYGIAGYPSMCRVKLGDGTLICTFDHNLREVERDADKETAA